MWEEQKERTLWSDCSVLLLMASPESEDQSLADLPLFWCQRTALPWLKPGRLKWLDAHLIPFTTLPVSRAIIAFSLIARSLGRWFCSLIIMYRTWFWTNLPGCKHQDQPKKPSNLMRFWRDDHWSSRGIRAGTHSKHLVTSSLPLLIQLTPRLPSFPFLARMLWKIAALLHVRHHTRCQPKSEV